ncbi:MAG: GNAT family N-acetyltransferase [Flammeovirgaceae bacterium]
MNNIYPYLETPKLILRRLEIVDAERVQKLLASNKAFMLPWIPWAKDEPQTVAEKKAQIRQWTGEFFLDQKYVYGLYTKNQPNEIIGLCFLLTRQGKGILEIGYIIDHGQTGKGYATESSYALCKLSLMILQQEKSLIVCSAENIASAKVPEKLGYQLEATRKTLQKREDGSREPIMRWAMYQEDFQIIDKFEPIHFEKEKNW